MAKPSWVSPFSVPGMLVDAPGRAHLVHMSPWTAVRPLLWTTAVLTSIHVLIRLATLVSPDFVGRNWLITLFDLGGEANIPSTFSGGLLLLCALLLGAIALEKRRSGAAFAQHWAVLSGVFFYLSLDELARLHDTLSGPLSRLYAPGGALLYLWVVPYGVAVLLLLLGSLWFLAHLPATTRRLFLLAGFLYVGGALGMELIEASSNSRGIQTGFVPLLSVAVEETLEMLGTVVFLYGLLDYLQRALPGFALHLSVTPDADGRK